MQDLGTLPPDYANGSVGWGVNDSGQVVGDVNSGSIDHAFVYSNGVMHDPGTLPGYLDSDAYGINDSGQVAGMSGSSATERAFLFSGGVMQDLGTLGGISNAATGINASGQVVGWSETAGGQDAYLNSAGKMIDLNSLIPPSSGWSLWQAGAINDAGQIVGDGILNGQQHDFY